MTLFLDIRVGQGYDIHRLIPGNVITLCGIEIPFHYQLDGHSDADVVLHALTDSLLGTLGMGDIGTHFPPSDPKWKGQKSDFFVKYALEKIRQKKGVINNVDITIICEKPLISAVQPKMISFLSNLLRIDLDRLSIKATTNETLGCIGREEGIAALCCTTVVYR